MKCSFVDSHLCSLKPSWFSYAVKCTSCIPEYPCSLHACAVLPKQLHVPWSTACDFYLSVCEQLQQLLLCILQSLLLTCICKSMSGLSEDRQDFSPNLPLLVQCFPWRGGMSWYLEVREKKKAWSLLCSFPWARYVKGYLVFELFSWCEARGLPLTLA